MDGEDKKPVRLTIYNQTFTLRASDPQRLQQAANDVDELMSAIAKSGNTDTSRAAILACLHLQDRIQSLELCRSFAQSKRRRSNSRACSTE
jgi:cell division protein ZapA